MISVMIFDDCVDRCESLCALLNLQDEFQCTGTYPDCKDMINHIALHKPDVVLMDIRMPGLSGIEATRKLKSKFPDIKVIMQTVFEDDENIFESLKAGAEGYLLKNIPGEKVLQSIRDVQDGGAVITPSIARRVIQYFQGETKPLMENVLTAKETEVLRLLGEGLSYKMTAARLNLSYHTVNAHVRKIYQKLSVNSITEAVSVAKHNRIL